jgi:hypothetical protein
MLMWRSRPVRRGHRPTLLTGEGTDGFFDHGGGGAHKAWRPRPAPRMKWRRSRGIPAMVANIFMSGVSAGTTRPVMKRSRRSRRRRE